MTVAKTLPFTTVQPDGMRRIQCPLHERTRNSDHVGALLEELLGAFISEFQARGDMSDGDVLRGVLMVLAVRIYLVDAPPINVRAMVAAALKLADDAVAESFHETAGRA